MPTFCLILELYIPLLLQYLFQFYSEECSAYYYVDHILSDDTSKGNAWLVHRVCVVHRVHRGS